MGAPFKIQVLEQPDRYFGIEGVQIMEVRETYEAVRCFGRVLPSPNDRPACRQCDDKRLPRVQGYIDYEVADTPTRGRKTILTLSIPRFRHRCGATIDAGRPAFLHPDLDATCRLVRYVEGETFRRPVLDIAREVGIPEPVVRDLALTLARRLHDRHNFPVPAVLGIDDLHVRRRIYTVVTDGMTGRPIALVDGGKAEDVEKELVVRRKLDLSQVRCVVSDMSGSNNAVVRRLFKKQRSVVHVADKFHVLRFVQRALSRVISQELDKLDKPPKGTPLNKATEMAEKAAEIRGVRKQLIGARMRKPNDKQAEFDLGRIRLALLRNKRISCAFWAKIRLHQAYDAPDYWEAKRLGLRFVKRAIDPCIMKEMRETLSHIRRNRIPIMNYWKARWPSGDLIRPTTGPTERRNGSIRKIWRSAHGFRKLPLFELRVIYEPWKLDVDIVMCAKPGCPKIEGPFPRQTRLFQPVEGAAVIRCSAHQVVP